MNVFELILYSNLLFILCFKYKFTNCNSKTDINYLEIRIDIKKRYNNEIKNKNRLCAFSELKDKWVFIEKIKAVLQALK